MRMLLVSCSGSAAIIRSKLVSLHVTKPSGGFLRTILRQLLGVVTGLGDELGVLDLVLGRLSDDGACRVEARATGAPGDLVELAGGQLPHPGAVVLGERREQHGADRHVDADAESVGAADHAQQPALSELLDEAAVLGQHARVVHADTRADEARQRLAEHGREAEVTDRVGDLVALLAGDDLDAASAPARARERRPARSARCRPALGPWRATLPPSRARA